MTTDKDTEVDPEYNITQSSLELFKDPKVLCSYRAAIMNRRVDNLTEK